ncbi:MULTISPECIES: LAETG motif-containing sortase-dependent surface protein [Streptomyces]|uniref:LAETG motif-containing sortase-dependent surface protein n=1 Tax=Streptomyces TaxID=1883 RepID=UPI00200F8780|nr:LAETG motif-containing sortase-dependent surface protein [Streptomyces sp. LRE541]UPZ29309.1 LPXTG cell wall anchor domain-containing protein [Streptomyces sp. LRE541]
MSARRSLLTATAAGTLLGALWFVPSANATDDRPAEHRTQTTTMTVVRTAAHTSTDTSAETATEETGTTTEETQTRLADTGSFDTTPYVAGGTLFLALGAGFVVYSVRRERLTGY